MCVCILSLCVRTRPVCVHMYAACVRSMTMEETSSYSLTQWLDQMLCVCDSSTLLLSLSKRRSICQAPYDAHLSVVTQKKI